MEDLEQLLRQGRFREAFERSQGLSDPQALLIHARAAFELGQTAYSLEVLEQIEPFADPVLEANRLTWLGWIHRALGNPDMHFKLAHRAAQTHQEYSVLFGLAHALPPQESLPVLMEVLAHARNTWEESQAAAAATRVLELMGRFREGFAYASLAYLRTPQDPMAVITYATLAMAGNDQVVLGDLVKLLEPIAREGEYIFRLKALNLLADIYLLLGQPEQALSMVEKNLELVSKDHLALVCLVAVRVYQVLGKQDRALMLVRAAQLSSSSDPVLQGSLQLALGLALYPAPAAQEAFEDAIRNLGDHFLPATLIARSYLMEIRRENPDEGFLRQLEQWSRNALRLYPALEQVTQRKGYRLRALGEGRLVGPEGVVQLTPRGLELLVLMLSRPQGWEREALSEALYGIDRPRAFKSEIYRLKKVLGEGLQPKPWRVTLAVTADFQELRQYLKRGEVAAALRVYQGPLLPHSDAPGLEELRDELAEELRQVVMASNDPNPMFALIDQFADDLELLERLREALPLGDWRGLVVLSRIRRLRKSYSG